MQSGTQDEWARVNFCVIDSSMNSTVSASESVRSIGLAEFRTSILLRGMDFNLWSHIESLSDNL